MGDQTVNPEVVTVGEAMLRLSVPPGIRMEAAQTLDVHVAGSEANVAVALARLGRSVAWVSRLPEGPLGRRVAIALRGQGVDLSHVTWLPDARLGIFYVELALPPRRVTTVYDRRDSPASQMSVESFPWSVLEGSRLVHISGITPALSASCRELSEEIAVRTRAAGVAFSLDVNYRAKLWGIDEARSCLTSLATEADLLIVGQEDARDIFGLEGAPESVLSDLVKRTRAVNVVLTVGSNGAAFHSPQASGVVPAVPVTVVDRLGAGDAFAAGVIDGFLAADLSHGVTLGTAMASLALGTTGDHLMSGLAEIEEALRGSGRSVDR
ncbi:MAG TPA: sugar kinase [Acidimicrobiia bacterium]|nr:sugar kinase [Acidimicrobiia bacterium]